MMGRLAGLASHLRYTADDIFSTSARVAEITGATAAPLVVDEFDSLNPDDTFTWRFVCGCSTGAIRLSGTAGTCEFGSVLGTVTTGATTGATSCTIGLSTSNPAFDSVDWAFLKFAIVGDSPVLVI